MKKNKVIKKTFSTTQIVLIILCILISVFILFNPSRYSKEPNEFKNKIMVVLSDSMTPTFETNDLIYCKRVPDGILPLDTVVTFSKKTNNGYILDTHRIVGYVVIYKTGEEITTKRFYYKKGEIEKIEDLPSECEFFRYITRGDKYTFEHAKASDYTIYESDGVTIDTTWDDKDVVVEDNVLAIYSGKRIKNIGVIFTFLQKSYVFMLVIILPLAILLIYNIYSMIKMVVNEKINKTKQKILAEVEENKLSEEMIKQKAILEYIKSINKELDD